jgi:hypothetical protein
LEPVLKVAAWLCLSSAALAGLVLVRAATSTVIGTWNAFSLALLLLVVSVCIAFFKKEVFILFFCSGSIVMPINLCGAQEGGLIFKYSTL